jgi:hypothetical protein
LSDAATHPAGARPRKCTIIAAAIFQKLIVGSSWENQIHQRFHETPGATATIRNIEREFITPMATRSATRTPAEAEAIQPEKLRNEAGSYVLPVEVTTNTYLCQLILETYMRLKTE